MGDDEQQTKAEESMENAASESSRLLKDNNEISKVDETEDERKTRWKSIWGSILTMFFNTIVTTIVYSSLWAYLKQMDPETTTWYLGLVHAGFNIAELCCLVLFGVWVQYRGGLEPLVFSLIFYIIGSAIYAWALTFGYYGKFVVLVSRIFIGCATGNDVVVTTLVAEQSTLEERTKAMVYLSVAQSLGFTLGPAIQACFVPLGNKGVYFKGLFLHINMYTIAGIACILFGIINLAVVIRMRNALKAIPPEVKSDENDNEKKKEKNGKSNGKPADLLAVIAVLTLFFITRHSLVFIEVMFAPLAMDEYALSSEDTLLIVGILLAMAGVGSAIVFVSTEKIAARIGDRLPLLVSIFMTFVAFAVHWPVSNRYPTLGHYYNVTVSTDEGLETKRLVTLGCAPTHSWCTTTPIITIPQFAVGFTLAILSFPVAYCLLPSMFTKVIQPGRQGILVSLFSISGNLSRIFGPTIFTSIYFYYGPKGIFGLMDIGLLVAFLITIIFYKRLVPYPDYIKRTLNSLSENEENVEMKTPLLEKDASEQE